MLGAPALAEDARFATVLARREHHAEADALIEAWTRTREPEPAMEELQAAGVAAGAAHKGDGLLADPHLQARGFWEQVDHPDAGVIPHLSRPFRFSRTPGSTRLPAPMLGEHTDEVLREVAGMSDEEIAELDALGVTNAVPEGAPDLPEPSP